MISSISKYFQSLKPCKLQIPQFWSKFIEFIHVFNWKADFSGWNLSYESASHYFMWFKNQDLLRAIYIIGFILLLKRKVYLVPQSETKHTHFIQRFLHKLGTTYNVHIHSQYLLNWWHCDPFFGINKSSKYIV